METKHTTLRSYSRCMRDGIVYALRHFSRILWFSRYALPAFVASFVLWVMSVDALSLRLLPQPGAGKVVFLTLVACATVLFMFAYAWLQTVFLSHQKVSLLNVQDKDVKPFLSRRSVMKLWLRVLAANVFRGVLAMALVLLYVILRPYLVGVWAYAIVLFALLLLFVLSMGAVRLFYMSYIYTEDNFFASLRKGYDLRKHFGRTMILELLSFWVWLGVLLLFGAPALVVRTVSALSYTAQQVGEPFSLPAFVPILYHVVLVIFGLGLALGALLVSYPVALNWQSIKMLEEEGSL